MRVVSSVRRTFVGGAILWALASACATTSATDAELARLRRDVHALRGELAETKTTLQRVQDDLTLVLASGRPSGAPAVPTADKPPNTIPALPVVRLGRAATTKKKGGGAADGDGGAVDDGSPPILIQLGPSDSGEKLSVDRDVLDKPDPVLATKGARATEKREKSEYDAALTMLRDQRNAAVARQLFVAFQARHPGSDLADNVDYWLAECSFQDGQWTRAIEELTKLVSNRPMSAKVPDALLLSGEAWLKLGKPKEAEDVLRRLIKTHPNSAARATADKRLAELGAT